MTVSDWPKSKPLEISMKTAGDPNRTTMSIRRLRAEPERPGCSVATIEDEINGREQQTSQVGGNGNAVEESGGDVQQLSVGGTGAVMNERQVSQPGNIDFQQWNDAMGVSECDGGDSR